MSSFDPFALVLMHALVPSMTLAYLFHEKQPYLLRKGWIAGLAGVGPVHPEHTLCTEVTMNAWHTAGRPVNAWTVDDEAELRRLDALGVDGVFCNDPGHALKVFEPR